MIKTLTLQTEDEQFYDITQKVEEAVRESGIQEGICILFCPHTTAAITINENADADVTKDILLGLRKAFPSRTEFRHMEGNSDAHLKASCIGTSETLVVKKGRLLLGTWQGVYFCEFDGPRQRTYYVKVMQG
ncbi:secondary thiamine-phosphate synthase enzyme [Tindallia magadiensis]|uniref:Secondary thiamine-phosphate synthase enzyme n=1 Tax=Tindallia magadiensis TaxID=69895 RepID=A0A1I3FEC3_9FIRM|nr:secondary thiamine-phosphate synthase enzyme YjbQ [Tindallia magadiensis]SFI09452.1 secondary thiamine-phosphate synthase enzyme [Tindallia magadiensis]